MFLQSASQELRHPPSIAWYALFQETIVICGVALVLAFVF